MLNGSAQKFIKNIKSPSRHARITQSIESAARSSPRINSILSNSKSPDPNKPIQHTLKRLSGCKDNSANVARRLLLGSAVSTLTASLRSNAKLYGVNYRTLKRAIEEANKTDNLNFVLKMFYKNVPFVLTEEYCG